MVKNGRDISGGGSWAHNLCYVVEEVAILSRCKQSTHVQDRGSEELTVDGRKHVPDLLDGRMGSIVEANYLAITELHPTYTPFILHVVAECSNLRASVGRLEMVTEMIKPVDQIPRR